MFRTRYVLFKQDFDNSFACLFGSFYEICPRMDLCEKQNSSLVADDIEECYVDCTNFCSKINLARIKEHSIVLERVVSIVSSMGFSFSFFLAVFLHPLYMFVYKSCAPLVFYKSYSIYLIIYINYPIVLALQVLLGSVQFQAGQKINIIIEVYLLFSIY